MNRVARKLFFHLIFLALSASIGGIALAQTTSFNYQGRLVDSGNPATSAYDIQFRLVDALTNGNQVGTPLVLSSVPVTNGIFSVSLDFGAAAFTGPNRWLEIGVRAGGSKGAFSILDPLQAITAVPYAIRSLTSTTADGLSGSCLNCVTSSQIASGSISNEHINASAAIAPTKIAGTAATLGSNAFTGDQTILNGNLSLPATANASTGVVNLGGSPFLHNLGQYSTFIGTNAGNLASAGFSNTGVGNGALSSNAGGGTNTAIGTYSLHSNLTGSYNTALGWNSLLSNTTGQGNTALGGESLNHNTTGKGNTAVGEAALSGNDAANYNTAIGFFSLDSSYTGIQNTVVGAWSMYSNQSGSNNTGSGESVLFSNTTGSGNTAIGERALIWNTTGSGNTAIGLAAGVTATSANANTSGSNNTFVGYQSGPATATQLTNATAIGANATVSASDTLVLGAPGITVAVGASSAATTLQVVGDVRVGTSGTNGCLQGFDGSPLAGTCSSDMRLKQNIEPFAPLLDKVSQLQPVSYDWRADEHPEYHFGSQRTAGLLAQDVEKLFPGMVATDDRGYKTVNYSQLPLLLLQAVRELKADNDALRSELEALKAIAATK
jgi:hypothetical protein